MRKIDAVLGAAGVALCVIIVHRIGGIVVVHELKAARAGLLILIGLGFLRLALQTVAWSAALRAEGMNAPVLELMGVRLASQAAGYLSVLGPVVSEPMRVRLLLRYRGSGTAATLADSGVYGLSSCLFGIVACVCAGLVMAHRATITPLVVLGAGLLAGAYLLLRSKPVLAPLLRALGSRAPRWLRLGGQIESDVRRFGGRHRAPVWLMFCTDFACQILLAGDIVAITFCLGIQSHAVTVLALEAGTRAARLIAGWIPARAGVDESGAIAAFAALGLPSASGLALALSRRLRDLLGCALGLAWLLWNSRGHRNVAAVPFAPRLLPGVTIGIDPEQAVALK